jgi:AAA domain
MSDLSKQNPEVIDRPGPGPGPRRVIKEPPFGKKLDQDFVGANGESDERKYRLSGRNIHDFLDLKIDPISNLLGNRWLTKGNGMFLIAPSGHGKSSFAIQLILSLSVGRKAFGIKPDRPLRILCFQSEDDDADTKKFVQMIRAMHLSKDEVAMLRANSRYEYRNDLTGADFIQALDDSLTEWAADLVIINPITGFFLASMKDEEKVAIFLRAELNRLLAKHDCATLLVHHTPKTNFTKLEDMQWYDWMYAMSGCATLTNWARAVLVIAPSKLPGTYRFIAAKRFDEIQWTEREYWFSHSRETLKEDDKSFEVIQWVPSTSDQIASAKPVPKGRKENITARAVWEQMSTTEKYSRATFEEWVVEKFQIGLNKAWSILKTLCDQGLIQVSSESRKGTNPLKKYQKASRTASTHDS